jgi:hypothetical protein
MISDLIWICVAKIVHIYIVDSNIIFNLDVFNLESIQKNTVALQLSKIKKKNMVLDFDDLLYKQTLKFFIDKENNIFVQPKYFMHKLF